MRRIINATYITLDGVIGGVENWPATEGGDDAGTTLQTELLGACDAVLLGRKTYESFAGVWEGRSGDPYTDRINEMRKYVVSTTLRDPTWRNTTVVAGDVAAHVEQLKSEPGKDIVHYGFGGIAHTLLDHGLLDEVRLWFHPFFLRTGSADDLLFRQGSLARFDLAEVRRLASGVVILTYRT
ncbi:dihydrofolate reductase family protein [Prauserella muralis]|uniref:Uncharacterized protein n=1 Tax=Prauserella muralis TaxID=588067 RepID=A0A2V4AQ81_9PSEU|nr:dihydrofolate reductase family protein [Prauserella muralis]PXY22783.1 hypothetical protein BAY60_23625 [Prauserella muralis]TWE28525.1 dihydrofolate reductase [Prauserella muralis]